MEIFVEGNAAQRVLPSFPTRPSSDLDTIHDTSTLTGATTDAGGTVKYRYYSVLADGNAGTYTTTGATSAGDKTVTGGDVPPANGPTFKDARRQHRRGPFTPRRRPATP